MDKTTHQRPNSRRSVTRPSRLIVGLTTVALAVGATTAFAGNDHGHHGDRHHGHHKGHKSKHHGSPVLDSSVFGSQTTGPVLFGVPPGGAPWVINKNSNVQVRRDGRVTARLNGLVIPTPPSNGTNPIPQIAASVYCNGASVGTTQPVPFSLAGNARINSSLGTPLPSPCLAPAVLFNPASGGVVTTNYIAATGE